jgi:hypothetical protein
MFKQSLEDNASQAVFAASGTVDAEALSKPDGILKQIFSSATQYVLHICQHLNEATEQNFLRVDSRISS